MAITWQAAGAISAGSGTNRSTAYPASIAAGDLLVLLVGYRPETQNLARGSTPSGWTELVGATFGGGYGTTLGTDVGNMFLRVYYKVADGTETGNLSVPVNSTLQPTWCQIHRLSNATGIWDLAATTGQETTSGSVSITFTSDPGVEAGDYILVSFVIPTDVTTPSQFSASALSQTGITFGTVTEVGEPDTSSGSDLGGLIVRAPVNSGTSTAAPVFAATAGGTTTNVRGPAAFVRIREGAAPPTTNTWRLAFDGTGQAPGDTWDEALYTAGPLDTLNSVNFTENTGAGGLLKVYDGPLVVQGTRAMSCASTTSAAPFVQMSESGWTNPERIYSTYLAIPTGSPIPSSIDFIQLREAANLHRCRLNTDRTISILNGASSVGTSTTALAFDTKYRITFRVVFHASTGVIEAKIFAEDGTSPLETITATAQNTGTVVPTNTRVGIPIAVAGAGPYIFDDVWCNEGGTDLYGQSVRIAHVGTTDTGAASNVSARNVAVPAGVIKGDVVFVYLGQWNGGGTPGITPPADFTQIYSWSSGDGNGKNSLWYKRLTGSDTGTYNWSFDASFWTTVQAVALRNVIETGDPIDTRETNVVGTFGTVTDMTLSTGVADKDAALWMLYNDSAGAATPPTGFTELADNDSASTAWMPITGTSVTATAGSVASSSAAGAALVVAKSNAYASSGPVTHDGVVALTATHTLTSAATVERLGAVAMTATHTLTSTAAIVKDGAVAMTAAHTLTSAATVSKVGTVAMTAAHTLTNAATISRLGTVALSATHTLTSAAVVTDLGVVALLATHTLTTTGVVSKLGTVTMTATHALTSTAVVSKLGVVAFSATHTLTSAAVVSRLGIVALVATHSLTSTGTLGQVATVAMTASHDLTVSGVVSKLGTVSMTAVHTLTSAAFIEQSGVVSLSATHTLTSAAIISKLGIVALVAAHTLTASGDVSGSTSAFLTAAHTLTVSAVVSVLGDVAMSSSHALTSTAAVSKVGAVAFVATHTLTSAAVVSRLGQVNMTATHALTVAAVVTKLGVVSMTATHVLTSAAVVTRLGVVVLGATHTLSSAAVVTRVGSAALTAVHTLTVSAEGFAEHQGAVAFVGTHTLDVAAVRTTFAGVVFVATSTLTIAGQVNKVGDVAMSVSHNLNVVAFVSKVGTASLAATHVLTVSALRTAAAVAPLTAVHTLTATAEGITVHQGAVALVAVHTLSSVGTVSKLATVNMISVHTLSVAGVIEKSGAASMSALHTLTAAALVSKIAAATMTATHTMSVAAQMTAVAAAILTAVHTLSAATAGSKAWVRHPSTQAWMLSDVMARTGTGSFLPAEVWVREPSTQVWVRV